MKLILRPCGICPAAGLHIDNFIAGFKQLAPNLKNSLMMVIPEALLSSLLGSFNGYLLSKWKFRGSDVIFSLDPVRDVHPLSEHFDPAGEVHAIHQIVW